MRSVLNATSKKIMICRKSNRWWNAHINAKRRMVWRVRMRRWHSEEAARTKIVIQKSMWQSKSTMWGEYPQNLMGAEVWRAAR
jgi:hypothetical protein